MLDTTICAPSISAAESEYHRFNLHRLAESGPKAVYQNDSSSPPQFSTEQTYYQKSTPEMEARDNAECSTSSNEYLFPSQASDHKFEQIQLQSQDDDSIDQLQSLLSPRLSTQRRVSMFGGVCTIYLGVSMSND